MNSYTSRNCFACYGLNKNQFCILNKQYEEQEYYDLLEACIQKMQVDGEWGEFLDPREAHIPYNDSTAHVWYPLTEQDAKDRGYSWQDESRRNLDFKGEFYSPLAIDEYDLSLIHI